MQARLEDTNLDGTSVFYLLNVLSTAKLSFATAGSDGQLRVLFHALLAFLCCLQLVGCMRTNTLGLDLHSVGILCVLCTATMLHVLL